MRRSAEARAAGIGAAITALRYSRDVCAAKKIDIDENCLDLDKTTKEETRRRYTAPIATFTTLFGGVVGYVGRERWSRVPLRDAPRRVGLTIEHGDGHQEIGLAIAF